MEIAPSKMVIIRKLSGSVASEKDFFFPVQLSHPSVR
jgi:hypothetical protein